MLARRGALRAARVEAEPLALECRRQNAAVLHFARDVRVHLPMKGLAESLNLSVSVGACLAHVAAVGALRAVVGRDFFQ